jgi:hypothetical protein
MISREREPRSIRLCGWASICRSDVGWVAVMFGASRLIIVLVMLLARRTVGLGPYVDVSQQMEHGGSLLDLFTQWDGVWYRMIATHGYLPPANPLAPSFFPFYPILVRAASFLVGGNMQIASVLVSNASLFGAALLLYRLLRLDHVDGICRRAIAFLMLSPLSFYFSAAYSESTFLFLTVGSALAVRAGRWLPACLLAMCAAATRPPGMLLGALLLIELLVQWRHTGERLLTWIVPRLLLFGLVPVGVVAYFTYCHFVLGDFFKPIHAHNVGWEQGMTAPWVTFFQPRVFTANYIALYQTLILIGLAAIVLGGALRVRVSYTVYAVVSALFALSWGTLDGVPRYISAIFPVYGGLALCATRWKWTYEPILALSVALLALCTVLFANAYQIT